MLSIALVIAMCPDGSFDERLRNYASLQTHWIAGNKWEIERIPDLSYGDMHVIEIRRNGVVKLKLSCDELGGSLIQAARAWYPVGFPVFVVSGHTGCSHGEETRFYAVKGGALHEMFRMVGEGGGPIFRDFDGDGKYEWIFDNLVHLMREPPAFHVYRQVGHKVTLWKKLPNRSRTNLPMPAVRYF